MRPECCVHVSDCIVYSRLPKELPEEIARELRRLGAAIRAARKARGLRQMDVATQLGISRMTLRAAERGEPGVHWAIVLAVLRAIELRTRFEESEAPPRR